MAKPTCPPGYFYHWTTGACWKEGAKTWPKRVSGEPLSPPKYGDYCSGGWVWVIPDDRRPTTTGYCWHPTQPVGQPGVESASHPGTSPKPPAEPPPSEGKPVCFYDRSYKFWSTGCSDSEFAIVEAAVIEALKWIWTGHMFLERIIAVRGAEGMEAARALWGTGGLDWGADAHRWDPSWWFGPYCDDCLILAADVLWVTNRRLNESTQTIRCAMACLGDDRTRATHSPGLIRLCPHWFDFADMEKALTLVHELTHGAITIAPDRVTKDVASSVCFDGPNNDCYGWADCERLANYWWNVREKLGSEFGFHMDMPSAAVNADNFAYWLRYRHEKYGACY
jgi:hypothetical protein